MSDEQITQEMTAPTTPAEPLPAPAPEHIAAVVPWLVQEVQTRVTGHVEQQSAAEILAEIFPDEPSVAAFAASIPPLTYSYARNTGTGW